MPQQRDLRAGFMESLDQDWAKYTDMLSTMTADEMRRMQQISEMSAVELRTHLNDTELEALRNLATVAFGECFRRLFDRAAELVSEDEPNDESK